MEELNINDQTPENIQDENPQEIEKSVTITDESAEVIAAEPKLETEPEPEPETESGPVLISETEPEPEIESGPVLTSETEPEPENESEPLLNSEPEPESEPVIRKARQGRPRKINKTEDAPVAETTPESDTRPHDIMETIELIAAEQVVESVTVEDLDEDHHVAKEEITELEKRYNEASREELVSIMEEAVGEQDVTKIKAKVAMIKVAFIKVNKEEKQNKQEKFLADGGLKEEFIYQPDDLEERFNKAFTIFKENKFRFTENLEKEKLQNLEAKKQVLEEIKQLISSEESLKKTYDEFRSLQDKWKSIGQVPKDEMNTLWQNYNLYVEKFFDKVRMNKELKDLDLKKNFEKKMELCGKVEELLIEKSMTKAFKLLQKYHDEWREIGPVPIDKKDEIWDRFREASDKINKIRQEYYDSIKGEQEDNFKAKTILCEKAEQIIEIENKSTKDWQDRTGQMNELLQIWKSIGAAPKYLNDDVWARFKTSLDTFFETQKEFYNSIKNEQVDNYNRKINLCLEAEAIGDRTDWKRATGDLLNLQDEWKKIGPVPKKYADKIWKRFRGACDNYFNKKNNYFQNIQQIEEENMMKKRELIQKVKEFAFSGSKNDNLEVLKGFQREWMEIGHVPMKDKDALYNEFREVVNMRFDDLKISTVEQNTLQYKSKIDNIKSGSDSKTIIYKEREFLSGKLNKLKEDINLWENNIGFFSRSKSADLLRNEFEQKIAKAKEEAKLLEEKLKILRENR